MSSTFAPPAPPPKDDKVEVPSSASSSAQNSPPQAKKRNEGSDSAKGKKMVPGLGLRPDTSSSSPPALSSALPSPLKEIPEEGAANPPVVAEETYAPLNLAQFQSQATPVIVAVRVRPPTIGELAKKDGGTTCVEALKSSNQVRLKHPLNKSGPKEFGFDAVFALSRWGWSSDGC